MKKSMYICLYLIFLMVFISGKISYASPNSELFQEILLSTKSEVVEYGLKISFEAEHNEERSRTQLLKTLGIDNNKYFTKEIKSEKSHYIEFRAEDMSGYIEYIDENSHGIVNIEIIKSGHKLELNELEHRLKKAAGSNKTIKLYRYIKAKTEIADTNEGAEKIVKALRNNKARNINAIDLGDSISITALTGEYERIKSGDTWIDFNSAICSYESGNYLIIGTPIIMKSY